MSALLDKEVIKDDRKFVYCLVVLVIFSIWFFSAPTKRMAGISLLCNNIKYKYAVMTHNN